MTTPTRPTQFTYRLSVTSQAVEAYGKSYPLDTTKAVVVLPMPFMDSWRTIVTVVVYVLGFAIILAAGWTQPWTLPLDPARIVPLLVTALVVAAIAVSLRLEHRRRSVTWRYLHGVWLRTKSDRALVALYSDTAQAAEVAARIKRALDAGETPEPVEYYREDHTVRVEPGAVEVDGRIYPITGIKSALVVNYTYQSMRSTVATCVYTLLFVAFVTQVHLPIVPAIAAFLLFFLIILGPVYYIIHRINDRLNYFDASCKLSAVGLFTTSGYVDAVLTPDAAYANSIVAVVNRVLQARALRDLADSRRAGRVRQVR